MTSSASRYKVFGLWLVACALALRLFVAPGFMPVVGNNGFTVSMCTGQGAIAVVMPGKPDPVMPNTGGCAFAALAVAVVPDVPLPLAAPVVLTPVARAIIPLTRTPHVGVPAPPPPAIGPPVLI